MSTWITSVRSPRTPFSVAAVLPARRAPGPAASTAAQSCWSRVRRPFCVDTKPRQMPRHCRRPRRERIAARPTNRHACAEVRMPACSKTNQSNSPASQPGTEFMPQRCRTSDQPAHALWTTHPTLEILSTTAQMSTVVRLGRVLPHPWPLRCLSLCRCCRIRPARPQPHTIAHGQPTQCRPRRHTHRILTRSRDGLPRRPPHLPPPRSCQAQPTSTVARNSIFRLVELQAV